MAAATRMESRTVNTSPWYSYQLRKFGAIAIVTLLTGIIAIAYLLPFGNMTTISLKSQDQLAGSADSPVLPVSPETFTYEGKDYPVYQVPTDDGVIHQWALVKKGRQSSQFVDPANADAGLIEWTGNWRTLR